MSTKCNFLTSAQDILTVNFSSAEDPSGHILAATFPKNPFSIILLMFPALFSSGNVGCRERLLSKHRKQIKRCLWLYVNCWKLLEVSARMCHGTVSYRVCSAGGWVHSGMG